VRLHISQGKATHVLEACLTAEGARSYKIDGKNRTGTQVKVCAARLLAIYQQICLSTAHLLGPMIRLRALPGHKALCAV
jgi:hypothetical protein